jgi:hypothetical protein
MLVLPLSTLLRCFVLGLGAGIVEGKGAWVGFNYTEGDETLVCRAEPAPLALPAWSSWLATGSPSVVLPLRSVRLPPGSPLAGLPISSPASFYIKGGYSVGGIYPRGGGGLSPFALPATRRILPCDAGTSPSRGRWYVAKFDGEVGYSNMSSDAFSAVGFEGLAVGPNLCAGCAVKSEGYVYLCRDSIQDLAWGVKVP